MLHRNSFSLRGSYHCLVLFLMMSVISLSPGMAGCGSQEKPAPSVTQSQGPQRYPLSGRVVSVNAASQKVVVDHKDIPGFMGAMTMPYPVKDASQLSSLSPEDQITADVVVNGDDVHLENIVIVKKAEQTKPPAAGQSKAGSSQSQKQ